MSCKSFHNNSFLLVEVYYDGSDQTKIKILGFPPKLSNDSADSAKLCPFLKIQLEKFHPTLIFLTEGNKLTVWLCLDEICQSCHC